MEITGSAAKTGITDGPCCTRSAAPSGSSRAEHDGEERLLTIGADNWGRLPEVIVVPADEPIRTIPADVRRRKFYDYLRKG
jgi:hypothetical protein